MKKFRVHPLIMTGYTILIFSYTAFFIRLIEHYGKMSFGSLILLLLILPVFLYYLTLLFKEVNIDEDGIGVKGIFGKVKVKWEDISSVTVSKGRKNFIFLTSKDRKSIMIDDTLKDFELILRTIGEKVDKSALPEDWNDIIKSYKRSYFSIILIYIAGFLLLFVILKSFIG